MKKKTLFTLLMGAGLLQACITNDMLNNNFTGLASSPVSQAIAKNWSGSMSAWLVTFQINQSGEGVYCYSGPTQNGLQKIKVSDDVLHIQDGTRFDITGVQANSIQLKAPYYGVKEHTLYSDPDLNKASVFCQKELSSSS